MKELMKEKPWLYTKRGDTFSFNGEEYIVRLNHMNDIYFVKKDDENYIFFSDLSIVIKDKEIEAKYNDLKNQFSS